MKNLTIVGALLMMTACGPNTSQTSEKRVSSYDSARNIELQESKELVVKPREGYFVSRNNIKTNDTISCWLFETAVERDSILGIAKTMTNTIDTPDFNKEVMAVIALMPTSLTQKIELSSASQQGDAMHLHFAIKIDTPKQTSTASAVWVGFLPRTEDVDRVIFYRGNDKIETIRIDKE